MNVRRVIFLTSFAGCLWQWYLVAAQDAVKSESQPAPVKETSPQELRDGELAISGRYARFERMLSQMADILGRQDPERADLLRRAVGKGREELVREDIEEIVELLNRGELGSATEKQARVIASLQMLLKLLQSEDRRSSVERERERLNDLLKDVRNILAEQRSARAATQNSQAPSSAAPGQQKALSETDRLIESMKEHDDLKAKEEQDGESEKGNAKSEDGSKKDEGDPKEADTKGEKSEDGKSKEGESKEGEKDSGKGDSKEPGESSKESEKPDGNPSEPGQPSSGKPSSGKQEHGEKQSGKKQPKQTPGREQIEKAKEQMQQALEALKQQEREKALANEDDAIEKLHEAAEKLDEMLRQLREEEKEMILASLEARFQRMLIAETQIHEGTISLAATPQADWLDQFYGRCRELAQQQSELTTECAQTVNLLREDGSSISILLAVEDIESDMSTVSGWLQESKVSDLTQSVQTDIIESLKQLIETTQKAMQEMKDQHQQQQEQDPNGEQESQLVELMAEIRMLRNLQIQVNRHTKKVDGMMLSSPKEDWPLLQKQIHDLAIRQQRLTETAKELSRQTR